MKRFAFHISGWVLAGLLLVGCTNKEPTERAAFISLLQGQVIDAPRAQVPALSETQREELGDYVDQYRLLSDFQKLSREQMAHLTTTFEHERLDAVAQLRARRDSLKADQQSLVAGQAAMQKLQARAVAERADWKQPADLQAVYSQAYDKVVAQPARELGEITATALAVLDNALQIVAYLEQHADQITIDADSAAVRDPSVQRQLNQQLDALNSHAAAVALAQERLQILQP